MDYSILKSSLKTAAVCTNTFLKGAAKIVDFYMTFVFTKVVQTVVFTIGPTTVCIGLKSDDYYK